MSEHCNKNTPKVLQVPCCDQPTLFHKVTIPASIGDEETNPPLPGKYRNTLLFYEATGSAYLYSSDGIPTLVSDMSEISRLEQMIEDEEDERKDADDEIWAEIETIEASSDVVDVVGTYAELQAYDTSKLHDKDLIKVLQDETRDDAITYYRWSTSTNTFTYVGAEGPYYTQSQTDTLLGGKQDTLIAGSNIQIAADGKTISATDTTYNAFTGATSVVAGTSGLVPAPAAGDQDKVLKGDGSWGEAAANTIFYRNSSETGATRHIYKSPDMTGLASMQDLLDANEKGQVILRLSTASHPEDFSDAYLQNAYVGPSDYQMLFLDEKAYTSFDTTQPTDTTFYYSRRELQDKLTAGTNIQINGATISATDTTYSAFVGTDGQTAGTAGLVPAPATTDDGKYLKADGTWDTISIPTVTLYSGTGQNTDGAMTQKAVTDSLFANNDVTRIQIGGNGLGASVSNTIAIGSGGSSATKAYGTMIGVGGVTASGERSTAIGNQGLFASGFASTAIGSSGLYASGEGSVAIGYGGVTASHTQSIALGGASTTGRNYELSLGKSAVGSSPEITRYIAHVTAGVNDTDAVNKKQLSDAIAGVPAANDATLTITQNGVSAGTFTANASSDTTIALTDTTYSAFTGTDGVSAGTAGLVPAPATTDDGKYLKADGTWDTISTPTATLYSGFGQNTDGAMTQKAVTDGIYSDYTNGKIRIGKDGLTSSGTRAIAIGSNGSSATGAYSVMVGTNGAQASGQYSIAIGSSGLYATSLGAIAIGYGSSANGTGSIVIGYGGANAEYEQSIALGGASTTGRTYELSLGQNASGQNPEKTRYIAHVTAGVNDTDAVNKKQLDDAIASIPAVNNISSGDWSALWQ